MSNLHDVRCLSYYVGRFEEIEDSPKMKVVSGPISEVQVVLPSMVKKNEEFDIVVRALDEWGNPCTDFEGKIALRPHQTKENLGIPNIAKINKGDGGFVKIPGNKIDIEGTYHKRLNIHNISYKQLVTVSFVGSMMIINYTGEMLMVKQS